MSTTQIRNLVAEINSLLSRPLGSASRVLSGAVISKREQLKHLRYRLGNASDPQEIAAIEKECHLLFEQIQAEQTHLPYEPQILVEIFPTIPTSQPQLMASVTESSPIQEISSMVNRISEPTLPGANEQIAALIQQTIQQTIQQAVQQAIEQNLAVERALLIGEITANLREVVESHRRSQLSGDLQELEQQKQTLRQEITQLEQARQTHLQQFTQDREKQQEVIALSFTSLETEIKNNIKAEISQVVSQIQSAVSPAAVAYPSNSPPELVEQAQNQTDRFLLNLDAMFASTFASIDQNIQSLQSSLSDRFARMQDEEQRAQVLIDALVERLAAKVEALPVPESIVTPAIAPSSVPPISLTGQERESTSTSDIKPELENVSNLSSNTNDEDRDLFERLLADAAEVAPIEAELVPATVNFVPDRFDEQNEQNEQFEDFDLDPELTSELSESIAADLSNPVDSLLPVPLLPIESESIEPVEPINSEYIPPDAGDRATDSFSIEIFDDIAADWQLETVESVSFPSTSVSYEEEDDFGDFLKELESSPGDQESLLPNDFDTDAETEIVEPSRMLSESYELQSWLDDQTVDRTVDIEPFTNQTNNNQNYGSSNDLVDPTTEETEIAGVHIPDDQREFLEWLNTKPESQHPPEGANSDDEPDFLSWLNSRDELASPSTNYNTTEVDQSGYSASENIESNLEVPDWLNSKTNEYELPEAIAGFDETEAIDVTSGEADEMLDLLGENMTDNAENSDESIILLPDAVDEMPRSTWLNDALIQDLNADLENLDAGIGVSPLVAANLDSVIRNTPFSQVNPKTHKPVPDSAATVVNSEAAFMERSEPQPETQEDLFGDYDQPGSVTTASVAPEFVENPDAILIDNFLGNTGTVETPEIAIPEIIQDPEALFDDFPLDEAIGMDREIESVLNFSVDASIDSIDEVPEIIQDPEALFASPPTSSEAAIAPSYNDDFATINQPDNQPEISDDPIINGDDIDALFAELSADNPIDDFTNDLSLPTNDDSASILDIDTTETALPIQFAPDLPRTGTKSAIHIDQDFAALMQDLDVDLDANFNSDFNLDLPDFTPIQEFETVLQEFAYDADLSAVLEGLDASLLAQNDSLPDSSTEETDDFFAALDQDSQLNAFADSASLPDALPEKPPDHNPDHNVVPDQVDSLDQMFSSEAELKLTEFADWEAQNPGNPGANRNAAVSLDSVDSVDSVDLVDLDIPEGDPDWDAIIFSLPNPPDPPASATEASTSLHSLGDRQPAPKVIDYKIDDVWFLGIDFGSTYLRASLCNANSSRVYALLFNNFSNNSSNNSSDNFSSKLASTAVFTPELGMDDPMQMAIATSIPVSKSGDAIAHSSNGSSPGEARSTVSHFKPLLKLGLPYRGITSWQPILQWSQQQKITLRWLQAALKQLIVTVKATATHPDIPDIAAIFERLSGVILGHPNEWSDTYVLNLREAILNAGLVDQAEQVMIVEQSIAPVLTLVRDRRIPQQAALIVDAGAATTSLLMIKPGDGNPKRTDINSRCINYAGWAINQDIVTQLLYPHWRLITNPERDACSLEHLELPSAGDPAPERRAILQQYLLTSPVGQQLLEIAEQLKLSLSVDLERDQWSAEVNGQPLMVLRRELESQVLLPFRQHLNHKLNDLLSNSGIFAEDIHEVWQLGGTMTIPFITNWLSQKLPNANSIQTLPDSSLADGLAIAPLHRHLLNIARQQYSDYFLLQEICRLNLQSPVNLNSLMQRLQSRGINARSCRDRIGNLLQGDLPAGLFPWLEPEKAIVLSDPSVSSELFTGRLFEPETDGSYQPNLRKFQLLRTYLQSILGSMRQTLNEPLVFPESTLR